MPTARSGIAAAVLEGRMFVKLPSQLSEML
jgi:hypothetical protein